MRVVDKIGDDIYRDAQLTKRGDVIVVCPDGWAWGAEELSSPDWRIVRVPGLGMIEAEAMLAPETESSLIAEPSPLLRRRMFELNLDAVPTGPRDLVLDVLAFRALKKRKPAPLVDGVIGPLR